MPPKSPKGKGDAGTGKKGDLGLVDTPLCEQDRWVVTVALLVGHQVEDKTRIDGIGEVIKSGTRPLFSFVSADELFKLSQELGGNAKNKSKDAPQYSEICLECQLYFESGTELPLSLLARLIKFKLFDIKNQDLRRRAAESTKEQENKERRYSNERRDYPGEAVDDKKKKGGKDVGKKESDKKVVGDKVETKLKKREDQDAVEIPIINDSPVDGSQQYVVLSGFNHPHLISHLLEVGINVDCVIRVRSKQYEGVEAEAEAATDSSVATRKKETAELEKFWKDVHPIMESSGDTSPLQDVARLELLIDGFLSSHRLADNPQVKFKYYSRLFDNLACLLYNLVDAKRHWKRYISSIKLINIPPVAIHSRPAFELQSSGSPDIDLPSTTPRPPVQATPRPGTQAGDVSISLSQPVNSSPSPVQSMSQTNVEINRYQDLMDSVPLESTSVPLILHCMLEQVVATLDDDPSSVIGGLVAKDGGLEEGLAKQLAALENKLYKPTSEKKEGNSTIASAATSTTSVTIKQPQLIDHHNNIARRLGHLDNIDGFNAMDAEMRMLGHTAVSSGLLRAERQALDCEGKAHEKDARFHQFMSFFRKECDYDNTTAAVHALQQFVLECVNLTQVTTSGQILPVPRTLIQMDIPWDDPYPYYMSMIPPTPPDSDNEDDLDDDRFQNNRSKQGKQNLSSATGILKPQKTLPLERKTSLKASGLNRSPRSSMDRTDRSHSGSAPSSLVRFGEKAKVIPSQILLVGGGSSRRQSEENEEEQLRGELPVAEEPPKEPTSPAVNKNVQKRCLDEWCFVEHMPANVILQAIGESLYTHPYINMYTCHRDNALLIVLDNPAGHGGEQAEAVIEWHVQLHSNVSFRNYLEFIEYELHDWIEAQDAEYEAELLAKEVEQAEREAEKVAQPVAAAGKKGADKDAKKGMASPTKGSMAKLGPDGTEKAGGTEGLLDDVASFVRAGSLKALKEDQIRAKLEEELALQLAAQQEAEKGKKGGGGGDKDKKKGGAQPNKRGGGTDTPAPEVEQAEPETGRFWPFVGYDTRNSFIHVAGAVSTVFPNDGGQIETERIKYKHGSSNLKSTLRKDGHVFTVHVLDPLPHTKFTPQGEQSSEHEEEKQVEEVMIENKNIIRRFGSLTASLADGISLAVSAYGPTGIPEEGKRRVPEPYTPPPPPAVVEPAKKGAASPKGGKKLTNAKGGSVIVQEEVNAATAAPVEKVDEAPIPQQPFQQLFITCPDGLNVTFFLESSIGICPESECDRKLLVKQSYPLKTKGQQKCEATRKKAMDELSRVITSDGTVIKTLLNATSQVLFPDGTIHEFVERLPAEPVPCAQNLEFTVTPLSKMAVNIPRRQSRMGLQGSTAVRRVSALGGERKKSILKISESTGFTTPLMSVPEERSSRASKETVGIPKPNAEISGYCIQTSPGGERTAIKLQDGSITPLRPVMVYVATDPQSNEVMHTREDKVIMVASGDGSYVTEHADGTRIKTTLYEVDVNVDCMNQETGESVSVERRTVRSISVECPGFAAVTFDEQTSICTTEFASGTKLETRLDGSYIVTPSKEGARGGGGGSLEITNVGTAVYISNRQSKMKSPSPESNCGGRRFVLSHTSNSLLEINDGGHSRVVASIDGMGAKVFDESLIWPGQWSSPSKTDITAQVTDGEMTFAASEKEKLLAEYLSFNQTEIASYGSHAPRFFVVYADKSGTTSGMELLRPTDVCDYLAAAKSDPMSVVVTEPLIDCEEVIGITVLRPLGADPSRRWVRPYSCDTIIPTGLKSRDLRALPSREVVKCGPKFGTTLGRGLSIGSYEVSAACKSLSFPAPLCPTKLEFRQLLHYRRVSSELRDRMRAGLQNYAKYVRACDALSESLQPVDSRSSDEQTAAEQVSECAEKKLNANWKYAAPLPAAITTGDMRNIYEDGCAASRCAACPPVPPILQTKTFDLEQAMRELAEETELKKALRNCRITPYFKSTFAPKELKESARDCCETQTKSKTDDITNQSICNMPVNGSPAVQEQSEDRAFVVPPGTCFREKFSPFPDDANKPVVSSPPILSTEGLPFTPRPPCPEESETANEEGETTETADPSSKESVFCAPKDNLPFTLQPADDDSAKEIEEQDPESLLDCMARKKVVPASDCISHDNLPFTPRTPPSPEFVQEDMWLVQSDDSLNTATAENNEQEKQQLTRGDLNLGQNTCQNNKDPPISNNNAANTDENITANRNQLSSLDMSQVTDKLVSADNENTIINQQNTNKELSSSRPISASQINLDTCFTPTNQNQPSYSPTNQVQAVDQGCRASLPGSARSSTESVCGKNGAVQSLLKPSNGPNLSSTFNQSSSYPVTGGISNKYSKNGLLTNMISKSSMAARLEVIPSRADFGVLKEGNTYMFNLSLKNFGFEACRFRVKQPPPCTGIKVTYTPGPVLSGLKTDLQLEIFAIAAGVTGDSGVGLISHNLEVTTENDTIILPITATVLTAREFDNRSEDSPRGGKAPGVKLVTGRSPVGAGIIRSRRD